MKTPEYYVEVGYEDHGYVSPELSSADTYPDYIRQEVLESVREIQRHQNDETVTFAFMTDIHYALSYNHEIRMKRTMNAYKELAKRVHIDKLMLGGDYTNEGCQEYKSDCFRELRAQFDGVDFYPVHGNHDDGTIWDYQYIKNEKSVNHLSHTELYNLFYNHVPYLGAKRDEKNPSLYYYVDDEVKKLRYICLDSGDIPYIYDENGKLIYNGQHLFAMSQMQLDWLVNEALSFEETGWSVAFFIHSVALPETEKEALGRLRENLPVLNEIISSYKQGADLKTVFGEGDFERKIDARFSGYTSADVIGVFVGDYHRDTIQKDDAGVNYILTANSVMYYVGGPTQVPRKDGDKSEVLFDVITVDKKDRKIYITRVGAGEDRVCEY